MHSHGFKSTYYLIKIGLQATSTTRALTSTEALTDTPAWHVNDCLFLNDVDNKKQQGISLNSDEYITPEELR